MQEAFKIRSKTMPYIQYSTVHNSIFSLLSTPASGTYGRFLAFFYFGKYWCFENSDYFISFYYYQTSSRGTSKNIFLSKMIPFQDLKTFRRAARAGGDERTWFSYGFIRYSAYRATPSRNSVKHNAFLMILGALLRKGLGND